MIQQLSTSTFLPGKVVHAYLHRRSFGQECGHWLKKSRCFSYYQLGEDVVELWDLEQLLNRLSSSSLLPFTGICSPCSSNENLTTLGEHILTCFVLLNSRKAFGLVFYIKIVL